MLCVDLQLVCILSFFSSFSIVFSSEHTKISVTFEEILTFVTLLFVAAAVLSEALAHEVSITQASSQADRGDRQCLRSLQRGSQAGQHRRWHGFPLHVGLHHGADAQPSAAGGARLCHR